MFLVWAVISESHIRRNEKTWIAMFGGTALALLVVYTPVSNGMSALFDG